MHTFWHLSLCPLLINCSKPQHLAYLVVYLHETLLVYCSEIPMKLQIISDVILAPRANKTGILSQL